MPLPKFLQPYLPGYDLRKLDKDAPLVRKAVITEVLNSGDDKSLRWLFRNYSLRTIREVVRHPKRGAWFPDSLSYWQKILGVKISEPERQKALFRLTP